MDSGSSACRSRFRWPRRRKGSHIARCAHSVQRAGHSLYQRVVCSDLRMDLVPPGLFQCRKWTNTDVSNLSVIGDNYESTTLLLVTGYQHISTAMSYNFGYEFRESWFKNVWFWSLSALFSFMLFWVTLVPGKAPCFWRVNCENEDDHYSVAMGVTLPIQNPWNSTVMPKDYRWTLMTIMLRNTVANIGWDYFVVNGLRKAMGARRRNKEELIPAQADSNVGACRDSLEDDRRTNTGLDEGLACGPMHMHKSKVRF
jgi:hypothetical protein